MQYIGNIEYQEGGVSTLNKDREARTLVAHQMEPALSP